MANKSRFVIAENNIKAYFNNGPKKVFTKADLEEAFNTYRGTWNLPATMYLPRFIDQLKKRGVLAHEEIKFEEQGTKKDRYFSPDATPLQVALSLAPKSYLSHYTAVSMNGLTNQVPKTIYVSFEQSRKRGKDLEMEQENIDYAFSQPQRKSNNKTVYKDLNIVLHNGMYTNRVGVVAMDDLPVTSLERTLIDIAVRPNYAGGVDSVLEAYKNAIESGSLSMRKLLVYLDQMDFLYPYHQSIGFYLQRAGGEHPRLEALRKKEMKYKFYLTYEMGETDYSKEWKLYYPKGM
ncbi:hypothetical protein GWC95_15430 [Sediminibacterium roseum]|uniref:AbiEi antitoxin C-terminal domain-containing protein n=1 Tax=Sediminibacterium roseum TaxID=1978412 RepID=A0ABW9ZYL0_9BACT|nr:type IV toxin-antitoxin system AbiEi family antitoxin [Sediminibacterium roseum]NCI51319.1 hypothetical protein [Sediminibacterium roseum]